MIHTLEELSLNMLPALHTMHYDGWVLRFANGYTRRANSVNPLYPATLPLDEKIAHCELLYRAYGLPTVYKLTPSAECETLDAALDAQGYHQLPPTSLMILDTFPAVDAAPILDDWVLFSAGEPEWFAAYAALNSVADADIATMQRMLALVNPPTGYLLLRHAGQPAAVGLGVVERGWLGIFDVATAADLRGRGIGRQLMALLLRWGQMYNAERAYLQVRGDNAPANRLYTKLGFSTAYQYWYRTKPL